jgi:hypothetical protein
MKLKTLVLLGLALLVVACSPLTIENYQQLKMGMAQTEVEGVIGTADKCDKSLGTLNCIWGQENGRHIKINFVAGKAIMFAHEGLQ